MNKANKTIKKTKKLPVAPKLSKLGKLKPHKSVVGDLNDLVKPTWSPTFRKKFF